MFIFKPVNRQLSEFSESFLMKLLLILLVCLCSACAGRAKPEVERLGEGYKVSVRTGGQDVSNFSEQLVHRILLSRSDFDSLVKDWPQGLPFTSKSEYDMRGNPSGLRITKVGSKQGPHLGLQQKDLVTAVGTTHTFTTRDMWQLFRELSISREATLTLVRQGKPHKILYNLQ